MEMAETSWLVIFNMNTISLTVCSLGTSYVVAEIV